MKSKRSYRISFSCVFWATGLGFQVTFLKQWGKHFTKKNSKTRGKSNKNKEDDIRHISEKRWNQTSSIKIEKIHMFQEHWNTSGDLFYAGCTINNVILNNFMKVQLKVVRNTNLVTQKRFKTRLHEGEKTEYCLQKWQQLMIDWIFSHLSSNNEST